MLTSISSLRCAIYRTITTGSAPVHVTLHHACSAPPLFSRNAPLPPQPMVTRMQLFLARRRLDREQDRRHHRWGQLGGHRLIYRSFLSAEMALDPGTPHIHPRTRTPTRPLIRAACPPRAPNASCARGTGAVPSNGVKERAAERHPPRGELRQHRWLWRAAERALEAGAAVCCHAARGSCPA